LRFSQPSRWFVEPFMGRSETVRSAAGEALTFCVGNPVVWLVVLPSVAYALVRNRRRRAEALFLALFAATWASMLGPARPIWILSSLTVLPFAFALVALAAADLEARSGKAAARLAVHGWLLAAMVGSLLLHPALMGRAEQVAYLRPLVEHMKGSPPAP
jgi:dolichyl-phosphate-mannose--protein O-mannosyl transferase